jgi:hypothetical protein
MVSDKFMFRCDLCGNEYQMGPHRYDGKQVPRYDIGVCMSCYESNWDGWNPRYEEFLISHLKEKSLPIPGKNKKGWFPRD